MLTEIFSLSVTVESLGANIDPKSSISVQCGQMDPKFQVDGVALPIIFARLVRPLDALQHRR